MSWITHEEFCSMNVDTLNRLMDRVVKKAVEEALIALPQVVGNVMAQNSKLKELSTKFYKDYPDLQDHRSLVAGLIAEAEQKSPGKSFEDILKDITPVALDRVKRLQSVNSMTIKPTVDNLKNIDHGAL